MSWSDLAGLPCAGRSVTSEWPESARGDPARRASLARAIGRSIFAERYPIRFLQKGAQFALLLPEPSADRLLQKGTQFALLLPEPSAEVPG